MTNTKLQSVIIPKEKFSRQEAINYVKKNFDYKKIDSSQRPNYYSFRQLEPSYLDKKGYKQYITKSLNNGVKLVIAVKK